MSTDVDMGTIYSVAVPVKRIKPQARVPLGADGVADGVSLAWEADPNADASARFPYGV